MGGQDGNRGYLLQAVIAILNSLSSADWEYVAIEPDKDNEKVDIEWVDKSGKLSVYQVKSSINNFDKADILGMLQELTTDAPDADSYTVVLIGTFSGDTTRFFNAFQTKAGSDFGNYGSVEPFKEKVTIELRALDISALDGQTESKVHEFLSGRGYIVPHPVVKLIALGLNAQFTRFATNGKKVAKSQLESEIVDWMKYNYPKELKRESECLGLGFYVNKRLDETGIINQDIKLFDILQSDYFQLRKNELLELAGKISEIKLPLTQPEPEYNNQNRVSAFSIFGPYGELSAVYEEEQIAPLHEKAEALLELILPDDFFNVGQAKRVKMTSVTLFIGSGPRFTGTKEETEKRELLSDFEYKLNLLNDLDDCWRQLTAYRIIPLVIINNGDVLHTRVDVQLTFSDTAEVLTEVTFPKPGYSPNMELLSYDEGLAQAVFTLDQDSKIKAYDNRNMPPINMPIFDPIFGKGRSEYERLLKQSLKWVFDYEIYNDVPGEQTVTCAFKSIKPKDVVALPSFLFVKSDGPLDISYTIKSDQSGGNQGKLMIN